MKIKTTLKKLKRGDVVSIDWIDAGDLDDSPSSWFSQEDAEKVFKEIPGAVDSHVPHGSIR